jgi:hypothetical protein
MRFEYCLISILLLTACGGRGLGRHTAHDLIIEIPEEGLQKEDVDIVNVTQVSGSEAIVETRLRAAFRVERVRGKWVVREVRLGHSQWEEVNDLIQTLDFVKAEETRKTLDTIAEAIDRYRRENGSLPVFKDYITLSDLLSPKYMTPLIRLDAWRRPLEAELRGSKTIVIRSAGPDGKFGTTDDIVKTIR